MMDAAQIEYRAVVQAIVEDGRHGPYAVATSEDIEGTITFSLSPDVWKEVEWPKPGFDVLLINVVSKRAGWRALEARFIRPSSRTTNL